MTVEAEEGSVVSPNAVKSTVETAEVLRVGSPSLFVVMASAREISLTNKGMVDRIPFETILIFY